MSQKFRKEIFIDEINYPASGNDKNNITAEEKLWLWLEKNSDVIIVSTVQRHTAVGLMITLFYTDDF